MTGNKRTSSLTSTNQYNSSGATTTTLDNGNDDGADEDDDGSLWMTSTQFSQLMDKQEELENMGYASKTASAAAAGLKNKKQQQQQEKLISPASYLDSEALLPFTKLKQVRILVPNRNR